MAAIITDRLKKQLLLDTYADLADSSNHYFVGIGKSDIWNDSDIPVTPSNSDRDIRLARYDMQSIKAVIDYSFVTRRFNWSSGAIYAAYDDSISTVGINSYYVLTDENQVYVCLQQAKNAAGQATPSTVRPTGTLDRPFRTTDGYVWKFLYSIGALTAARFMAANYMPVTIVSTVDSASTAAEVEQLGIQQAAVAREIVGFRVTNGGTGYETNPTITVVGDGIRSRGTATLSGGAITKIDIPDSNGIPVIGYGYKKASVSISAPTGVGGIQATAVPIFGPLNGFGADPRDDLKATALMLNVKPSGDEGGTFIVGNDFRQVVLIKNPTVPDTDSDYIALTGSTLRTMRLQSVSANFSVGNTIKGATSTAQAFIDDIDSSRIYYHQNEATGFLEFIEGEAVSETNGNGSGVLQSAGADADANAYTEPDVNNFSGEIMYIDNRASITRTSEQTEDIKVVIQL